MELLRAAVTDPARVKRADPGTPEICNIYTMHQGFSPPEDVAWCEEGCRTAGIGCVDCKKKLAENMDAELAPMRERHAKLPRRPRLRRRRHAHRRRPVQPPRRGHDGRGAPGVGIR